MPVNIKQITDAWAQRKSASLVINNTSVTIVSKSYKSLVPVQCLSFLTGANHQMHADQDRRSCIQEENR
jgi:hypothetical protein